MRVFLTGGTGFIGAYVIRELLTLPDMHITACYRAGSRFDLVEDIKDQVHWVDIDLDDIVGLEELLVNIDTIVHIAGMVSFYPKDRDLLHKVNVSYTATLVNLALDTGISRFIHFSSVTALGRAKQDQLLNESSVWTEEKAYSQYALSKYLGEREVWRGFAEGLNGAIISPSMVLGSGRWEEGMCKVIKEVDKMYRYYPAGSNAVVDVRDVAKMTSWLVQHPEFTQRRVICSSENIALKTWLQKISEKLGKRAPSVSLSSTEGRAVTFLAKILSALLPRLAPISAEELKISNMPFAYDNRQSIEKLGFTYRSLDTTLNDMVADYQKSKE